MKRLIIKTIRQLGLFRKKKAKNRCYEEDTKKYVPYKTADLYEASWLVLNGAVLQSVVLKKRMLKKGKFVNRLKISLDRCKNVDIENWKHKKAYGEIREFSAIRKSIKKQAFSKLNIGR